MERSSPALSFRCRAFARLRRLFLVIDVAAGKIKIVSGLSGTGKFLKMLGSLFDTFGIHAKRTINKGNNVRAS